MLEKKSQFSKQGYLVLKQAISQETVEIAKDYFTMQIFNPGHYRKSAACPKAVDRYGDPLGESLLIHCRPLLEEHVGLRLHSTYSFVRLYRHGSDLRKHTDRPSCEISATLTIGYKASELWPMMLEVGGETKTIELDRGDLLVFQGNEQPHWREPFQGDQWIQVFLHYVDAEGNFQEYKYDKRAMLGIDPKT